MTKQRILEILRKHGGANLATTTDQINSDMTMIDEDLFVMSLIDRGDKWQNSQRLVIALDWQILRELKKLNAVPEAEVVH